MNTTFHYNQTWVNRRCRRAYLAGRTAMYFHHYRESWRRYGPHHLDSLRETFGVPVHAAEEPVGAIAVTVTELK